jgi:hypothetical protein
MTGEQPGRQPSSADYQIRVRGHLGATMLRAFPALHARTRDGDTLLRGGIADQAALHGVLAKVEALGLELVEVRRLPHEPGPAQSTWARDAESPGRT